MEGWDLQAMARGDTEQRARATPGARTEGARARGGARRPAPPPRPGAAGRPASPQGPGGGAGREGRVASQPSWSPTCASGSPNAKYGPGPRGWAGGRGPRRVDSPAGPGDLGRAMRPHPPPPHRTPGRGQRSNPGLPDADGQGCPVCHLPHAWLGRVATRSLLPSSRGGSPHLPGACPLLPSIRFGDAQLSPGGPCLQPRWLSHSGSETAAAGRR